MKETLAAGAIVCAALAALPGCRSERQDSGAQGAPSEPAASAASPTMNAGSGTGSWTPSAGASGPSSPSATPSPASAGTGSAQAAAAPATPAAPASATAAASASAGPAVRESDARLCRAIPELERWAQKRDLEPALVRAFAATLSGLDNCAAAKACAGGQDAPGCLEAGPQKDEGYDIGLDEMIDPAGACAFENSPRSAAPEWRWLGMGLMQTLEPPYTYWPAIQHPEGQDGQYFEILERSGMSGAALDFSEARACNARFNPFRADDSLCLGTSRLKRIMNAANTWVRSHASGLNLGPGGQARSAELAIYAAGHIYAGTWYSTARSPDHPRCAPSVNNAECWIYGFGQSRAVDRNYCGSDEGKADDARCSGGAPIRRSPEACYGHTDFTSYVRECELPYLPYGRDHGAAVLGMYARLKRACR